MRPRKSKPANTALDAVGESFADRAHTVADAEYDVYTEENDLSDAQAAEVLRSGVAEVGLRGY